MIRMADFEAHETTFPFGQYRGKRLKEIPVVYLNWALGNMENMRQPLREAIVRYLESPSQFSKDAKHEIAINQSCEAVVSIPLPRGNKIEVKLKKKLTKEEIPQFRKVVKFIEQFITEVEE